MPALPNGVGGIHPATPEEGTTMIRHMRPSGLKRFLRCRRSWWLGYGMNMEEPPTHLPRSGQRDIGTLFHLGAEAIDHGQLWEEVINADEADRIELTGPLGDEWTKVYKMVRAMLGAYVTWIAEEGADAGESTLVLPDGELAIEHYFGAFAGTYHGDDVWLWGKPDRLRVDEMTGLLIVDDYKTVQTIARPALLDVDYQNLSYDYILRANGLTPGRFRHTQAKKVMHTARANPPFFGRHDAYYNESQRESFQRKLGGILSDLVLVAQRLEADQDSHHAVAYPTPNRDCSWDCDFKDVCPMMDNGDYWREFLADSYVEREQPVGFGGYTDR